MGTNILGDPLRKSSLLVNPPGATDGRDLGCQWQLTVDDNTEIASSVRDGDASAEHQDIMAVNLVQQLTWAKPQQLHLAGTRRRPCKIGTVATLVYCVVCVLSCGRLVWL